MAAHLRLRSFLLSAAVLLGAYTPAFSWGGLGHRTVAIIAEHRLTPQAQAAVSRILGPTTSLADISTCADDIKRKPIRCGSFTLNVDRRSKGWHYIDIPLEDTPAEATLNKYCRQGKQCAPAQAKLDLDVLRNPSADLYQKQVALMFLVHFIGDIHQPLHNVNDNDGGGNSKLVTFFPGKRSHKKTNLHHIWDNILIKDSQVKKTRPEALAAELERHISGQDAENWIRGDVIMAAALESFNIAKKRIYPSYFAGNTNLGRDYQAEMQPIAFGRLEMAGVRLAYLLNENFKP